MRLGVSKAAIAGCIENDENGISVEGNVRTSDLMQVFGDLRVIHLIPRG
jgi:hypothetical protein